MVYCGRPSKACKQCRVRRLRCDLVPAGCGQCARAGLTCSGYRDISQLRLRNQSESIIAKFNDAAKLPMPQGVRQSIEHRARDLFFSDYVYGNSMAFEYLQEFYPCTPNEEYLSLGIDAVSLAYYSAQMYCSEALKKARGRYSSAVALTNASLQSPSSAAKDATVLTVLLLDLFDKLIDRNPKDVQSWTTHMSGALALIQLRGPKQFRSSIGLRMFEQFSSNLVINCMQREILIPDELISLRSYATQFLDVDNPKWRFTGLMIRFVELRVALNNKISSEEEAIERAVELDNNFAALSMRMLSTWPYDNIYTDAAADRVYDGNFHIYPNHGIAHMWNIVRLSRIFLNEAIYQYRASTIKSLSALPPLNHDSNIQLAANTIMALAAEICASAPQYVLRPSKLPKPLIAEAFRSTESDESEAFQSQQHSNFHPSHCSSLIYPLYIAGQSRNPSMKLKEWVIMQLRFMADSIGIKKAHTFADVLERDETHIPTVGVRYTWQSGLCSLTSYLPE